ncbi:hypothetical protein [Roseovarius gaetbuli]|nr:hypothetical protein [Roseovarius gaetbuli]
MSRPRKTGRAVTSRLRAQSLVETSCHQIGNTLAAARDAIRTETSRG